MKTNNLFTLKVFAFVLIAYLGFSCRAKEPDLPELVRAERLMKQHPDSALLILKSLPDSSHLSPKQNAMYCLLLTEAEDKNFITHETDSLMRIAVDYFEQHDDLNLRAKALFYRGRVAHDLSVWEPALDYYLRAISYAKQVDNYNLLAMTYSFVSKLYRQQNIYDKALEYAQNANEIFVFSNDSVNIPYAIRNIGRVYLFMKETDSAFVYFRKALKIAEDYNNLDAEASILNDIGSAYRQKKDYHKAIEMIQQSIPLNSEDQKYSNYLSLARIYNQMDNLDSLTFYIHKASKSEDKFVQVDVCYFMYKLALLKSDYKEAFHYYLKYQESKDKIKLGERKIQILGMTYKHGYKIREQEMIQEADRERFLYFAVIMLLFGAGIIGYSMHFRSQLHHNRLLRLQDKKYQREKELRLQNLDQIRENKQQIEKNEQRLIDKETDLQLAQRELLIFNSKYLNVENELISLKREELEFKNHLFNQTGYIDRIRVAGMDAKKMEYECDEFTAKHIPDLMATLNELYDNFAVRLQKRYPLLKDRDIEICCLLKAGAKTGNIAYIIAMTPNAVTKKKRQILEKMGIVEDCISLEQFLATF